MGLCVAWTGNMEKYTSCRQENFIMNHAGNKEILKYNIINMYVKLAGRA
jgi:hypothetical protein